MPMRDYHNNQIDRALKIEQQCTWPVEHGRELKMTTPREMVEKVANIVSLPDIYFRISRLIEDPACTSTKLAEVVAYDPGLTVRVLKLANSVYYGRAHRVETVAQAVTLIGTSDLRHLVLATSTAQAFRTIATAVIDMDAFWQHSVCCALATRSLATRCQPHDKERGFVTGLLHDIGYLLIGHQAPTKAWTILSRTELDNERYPLEQELLGFTHADVGAELLKSWELPASLWEPVECHHAPVEATLFPVDAALLHIGNILANTLNLEDKTFNSAKVIDRVDPGAWPLYGQSQDTLDDVATEVHAQWFEVFEVIWPGASLIY
jgi:HD-like signal output (HDOD) protein